MERPSRPEAEIASATIVAPRPILSVRNLHAYYGSSHILQGISLTLPEGGAVALLGRNGAGKTTTFRALMNLGPRVEGKVFLHDEEITGLPTYRIAKRGVQLVPEDRRIFARLSVEDNLRLGMHAAAHGVTPLSVEEVLDLFPLLKPLRARSGGLLSGGEQQLLTVARAVISRPRVLLLDEPTEGLAPVIVQSLAETLRVLCRTFNLSLLLAEQNILFTLGFAQSVYVIEEGTIVWSGSTTEFEADPSIRRRHLAV